MTLITRACQIYGDVKQRTERHTTINKPQHDTSERQTYHRFLHRGKPNQALGPKENNEMNHEEWEDVKQKR